MRGHKRKAAEQLTRNSIAVLTPVQPAALALTPAPEMGGLWSSVAQAFTGAAEWLYAIYVRRTYTDMTHQSNEVVTSSHTQFSSPRHDGTIALKRSKHKHQRTGILRSKSMDDMPQRAGCGNLDISGCRSEGEASKRVNDFWSPPEFEFGRKPLARPPRRAPKDLNGRESERVSFYQTHDGPPVSRMTPDRSSSPQSSKSVPDFVPGAAQTHFPTTPESLPRDDVVPKKDKTDAETLADSLSRLLAQDEEQEDGSLMISGYANSRRAKLAAERKAREKQEALRAARALRLRRRQPRKALVQALQYEWDDVVDGLISSHDHQRVITTSIGGTELRLKDFTTLLGKRAWLNDEIINAYIEWAVDAANKAAVALSKELGEPTSTIPKFIAHNSFFYENLIKKGPSSTQGLMRRKKAPGASLLEVDTVFVPICKGSHWTVGAVRPIAKTIEYFDSMGGGPTHFSNLMRDWLKFQLGDKYIESEWTTPRTACAHQSNGYDCGVFVCTNAFCVALGLDTSCYDESDMEQQRRNIAAVLINRGFIGDFAWNGGGL